MKVSTGKQLLKFVSHIDLSSSPRQPWLQLNPDFVSGYLRHLLKTNIRLAPTCRYTNISAEICGPSRANIPGVS